MNAEKLAKIISVILGPQIWLPLLFIIIIFNSGLNIHQITILLPCILFLQVIIPLGYLYFAPKFGFATSWDLPKRKERYPFFVIVIISELISLFLIHQFGTIILFNLNLILFLLLLLLFFITFFWKISLHTALNTIGSILINFLFNGNFIFLYLTIPIIFWARYKLHKHSIFQLLAGIIISAIFLIISLKLFNY